MCIFLYYTVYKVAIELSQKDKNGRYQWKVVEVTILFEKCWVFENVQVQYHVIIAISYSITILHYACLLFINSWVQQWH